MTDQVLSDRQTYRDLAVALMRTDERLVCLDSDTGLFSGVDFSVAARRYFNVGIAEQNLLGMAAGLARAGRVPLVNTMATFATTRALESVKVDIAYPALPVRIAATHGGLAAGHLGPTHHALEDIAIMRSLPTVTVLVPADTTQTSQLFEQSLRLPGPSYLRLGRDATPALPPDCLPVVLGEAQVLRPIGGRLTLVCCGPYPTLAALSATTELERLGITVTVLNMHTVAPLDMRTLVEAATASSAVVTVEEHWTVGGLGSAVAETLAEQVPRRLVRVGVPHGFVDVVGTQPYLANRAGINADRLVAAAHRALG